MVIKVDGVHSDNYLVLSVDSLPEDGKRRVLALARSWAPRKAKSMDIDILQCSEVFGHNRYRFKVSYYTTRKEGRFRVYRNFTGWFYEMYRNSPATEHHSINIS